MIYTKEKSIGKNGSLVDFSYIEEISGGDEDFIKEMISLFLHSAPEAIKDMKDALENRNAVKLGQVAHKMKPSAIYMGNKELETLLKDLQNLKENHTISEATTKKVEDVEEIVSMMMKVLKEKI